MSSGRPLRELGRRAALCAAVACAVLATIVPAASADATFGGNPDQVLIPEITEEVSCAPFNCTLFWIGPGGSDLVPFGPNGGVGTVTSVTLPPMPAPGSMQAVVLTSSTTATKDPAKPTTSCCAVKEVSAPFTVTPNQTTTVPLSLHVSGTAAANLGMPGDTATVDGVGISVLDVPASAPLKSTEDPADNLDFWVPPLTATNPSFVAPQFERPGFELAARFTYAETPGAKPPTTGGPGEPGTGPGSPPATSGIRLKHGVLRPNGRTLTVGTATNPPTASTRQTLTVPAARLSSAGSKSRKPVVIGRGKTAIPAGKKAPIVLNLSGRGRAALARAHALVATVHIVATDSEGKSQSLVRRLRLSAPAKQTKRSR